MKSAANKRTGSKQFLFNAGMTLLLPVFIYVLFAVITGGRFGGYTAVRTVARQTVIPVLIAMAMSFDMMQGTWDFSSGSVVYASAIIGGNLGAHFGVPGIILCCMLVGLLLSAFSGLLYTLLRIPALVLSIGCLMVYEALPRIFYQGGVNVSISSAVLAQPPYCFIVFGIAFVIYYVTANLSEFGHNIKAIGANQTVAYSSGVDIRKMKFITFLCKGFFLGIAGFMYLFSNIKVSTPDTLTSIALIFEAMTGVFIAMFLSRFCGMGVGMMVGVFSMKLMTTAMVACGMAATVRSIVNGFFLLLVLCISTNQSRAVDWRKRKAVGKAAEKEYRALPGNH